MTERQIPRYTRRIALQSSTVLLGVSALSPLLIRPSYASALKSGFAGERIGLSPEDRDYLLDADHVPQYGKSQANVVIAEFSDFRCPHCRTSTATLRRAFKRDGEVLWTFAALPILGLDSEELARLGYAAHEEGNIPIGTSRLCRGLDKCAPPKPPPSPSQLAWTLKLYAPISASPITTRGFATT